MCGIAGFIGNIQTWEKQINRMLDRIVHRGPDAYGIWTDEEKRVVLGHRRLSILDLSDSGKQPMMSVNNRYLISFNGEIYNWKEIRKELENCGEERVFFSSNTDTEVLLEAISKWGIQEALKKARGMFALALYDRKRKELILARDRMGEKPLYYGRVGSLFVFSSDIACFEQIDGFSNKVDLRALKIFFEHGYIPTPYSIYENIYKLEAGTILTVSSETGEVVNNTVYWSIEQVAINGQENLFKGNEQDATEELKRKLINSCRQQMMADVPVGAFLSAGIDSSTVVSVLQEISDVPIKTFTIGLEDAKQNEAVIAKEISNILGTDHTEWYITTKEAQEIIPKLKHFFSEPFADASQIPTMLVSKLAKGKVTVALGGDGGDELFCGYKYYDYINNTWRQISKFPEIIRRPIGTLARNLSCDDNSYIQLLKLFPCKSPEELYCYDRKQNFDSHLFSSKIKSSNKNELYKRNLFSECQRDLMLMDLQMYHTDDILTKVDRSAMAYSLETRIPLLNADLVEFAWSLPFSYIKEGSITKKPLRNILHQYIPKELTERPKTGFTIPLEQWLLEKELREWAEDLISEAKHLACFNSKVVDEVWKHFTNDGVYNQMIWCLLIFVEWTKGKNVL